MAKKEATKIVLQSFISHRLEVNFRRTSDETDDKDKLVEGGYRKGDVIRVGNVPKTVVVPAKQESPKNILILTPADFEAVKADLQPYLDLGQRQGVTVLEDIPGGYWDPAQRVAEAEAKRVAAETALSGAQERIGTLEGRIDELKEILVKTFAWKDDGK